MNNKEKIVQAIENMMQLSTDMYYDFKYDDKLDLEVYLTSIEEWVKVIRKKLAKHKNI